MRFSPLILALLWLYAALPAFADSTNPDANKHQAWIAEIVAKSQRTIGSVKREAWMNPAAPLPQMMPNGDKPPVKPLLVFVSFSMPRKSLRALLSQARQAGATVLLRGLVNNSFQDTKTAFADLATEASDGKAADIAGLSVDPKLFNLFRVTAVPVFVVMNTPLGPCLEEGCHETQPAHDRIAGNMTLPEALRLMVREGDFPERAQTALARFKGGTP